MSVKQASKKSDEQVTEALQRQLRKITAVIEAKKLVANAVEENILFENADELMFYRDNHMDLLDGILYELLDL